MFSTLIFAHRSGHIHTTYSIHIQILLQYGVTLVYFKIKPIQTLVLSQQDYIYIEEQPLQQL